MTFESSILLGARWLVGFVFTLAALGKGLRHKDLPADVARYGVLPPRLAPVGAYVQLVAEVIIAVALLFDIETRVAGALAAILITAFCYALVRNLLAGRRFRCGCGLGSGDISWALVLRNATLLVPAIWLSLPLKPSDAVPVRVTEALPIALTVVIGVILVQVAASCWRTLRNENESLAYRRPGRSPGA